MLMMKGVLKRLIYLFTVLIQFANSETTESNKFQEFVQIQDLNGKMLCGGVVIDSEFVATMASCLDDGYAYSVKAAEGEKLIMKNYTNMDGLMLLRIQPSYTGQPIPTAVSEPQFEQKCMVIGWDHDHNDHTFVQSVIEANYSINFFDIINHQQFETACESPAVKAVICNGFLAGFILKKCINGGPEYSHIEVYNHNEWINKVFKCAVDHEATCNFENTVTPRAATMMEMETSSIDSSMVPTTTTTTTTESTTPSTTTTQQIPDYTTAREMMRGHPKDHQMSHGHKTTAETLAIVCLAIFFSLIMY